jgi:hypothetical protein
MKAKAKIIVIKKLKTEKKIKSLDQSIVILGVCSVN